MWQPGENPNHDDIAQALAKHGIVGPEQRQMAGTLRQIGGIAADVDALVELAKSRGADSPVGLVVHWLRGDVNDLTALLLNAGTQGAAKQPPQTFGNDPALATPANPYGWRSSSQRSTQHCRNETPGAWCPYRQAYNRYADGTDGGPPAGFRARFGKGVSVVVDAVRAVGAPAS